MTKDQFQAIIDKRREQASAVNRILGSSNLNELGLSDLEIASLYLAVKNHLQYLVFLDVDSGLK